MLGNDSLEKVFSEAAELIHRDIAFFWLDQSSRFCPSGGSTKMRFAAARWARCRNAHLSSWSRNLNADLRFYRGVAAAPMLRLAAEPMPITGFLDALDGGVAASQAIAAILEGVAKLDGTVSSRFAEMLDTSVLIYKCSSGLLGTQPILQRVTQHNRTISSLNLRFDHLQAWWRAKSWLAAL
eukprot:s320_g18.t1